jgi:hypothetical protein
MSVGGLHFDGDGGLWRMLTRLSEGGSGGCFNGGLQLVVSRMEKGERESKKGWWFRLVVWQERLGEAWEEESKEYSSVS